MKKQFTFLKAIFVAAIMICGTAGSLKGQVTLILPNASTANYSTIEAAYAAINFTTNAGAHFIELESAYTGEASYPLTLGAITGASATNKVTIRPAAGQTKVLEMTSSSSAPITTITTSAAANTTTKFMTSATGLSAGMKLAGYGIVGSPANFTTISDITDGVVTMATNFSWNASFNGAYSTMIACPTSGTILKVASPTYINSTTLDYSSITTGIVANMIVGGNAIQPGTTIVSATLNSPSAGKTRVVLSKALVSGNQTTPTLYCTDPSTGVYVIPTGFQMPVSSTIGVAIGMTVVGTGVGSGFTGAVNVVKVGATDVYTNASGTYAASAALTFTTPGALNPAIKFDGAKYVTIDGQSGGVGGTKNLTLSNTLTFNNASTLYFVNDASYNTIKYCNILGSSVSSTSNPTTGTVFISTTTGTTARAGSDPNFTGSGNLNNTIDNCDIANASGGLPTVGVYMNGTATYTNESNTISNCNIYNYFNPGAFVSAGIYINDNTKTTTINANKFYQTAERTYTHVSGEGINYGIFSATGSSDSKAFTNNIIGYSSNSQTGTMTLNGNKNFRFVGIYVGRPLATAYGNLITDIDISTSSVGATHAGTVTGIYAANNFPAATALSPNIIRNIIVRPSASTGGTVTTHTLCGLGAQGGSAPLFYYNNVYNLQVIPTSDAVVSKLTGIYIGAGANTAVKFSNIYDLTCGASGNSGAHTVTGIYSVGISQYGGSNINTVERNKVYNLKAISSGFPTIIGITSNSEYAGKTSVIKNNFIILGENVTNDAIIYGIFQPTTDATNLLKYYHNSVYIGGAALASPTKNTFAFYSAGTTAVTTGTNELKNNIFSNQRTITGTGKHYAIGFATASVLKTCDYNLYYASPVGLAVAVEKGDLTVWKDAVVAGSDAASIEGDPKFIAPTATTPNLEIQTYSSAVATKGVSGTGVTDDYNGTTRATIPAIGAYEFTYASAATDNYRSLATGNWGTAATWQSSVDNSNWATATLVPGATASSVTIQNAHTVSLDANATTSSLSINSGSLLNVNAGKQLTVSTTLNNSGTLNLLSTSEDGTATILTPATLGGTGGTYNTNQYLTTGRNWYVSSPVASAQSAVFGAASSSTNKLYYYYEPQGSSLTLNWPQIINNTTALDVTRGYVANMPADGVITFNGGALNTGAITTGVNSVPALSRTPGQTKEGFNLVGNPYPSYLNWSDVVRTNVDATIWYRTKVGVDYKYFTYLTGTGAGEVGSISVPADVTNLIPPMQAFWVRVSTGQTSGSLAFSNSMRAHKESDKPTNKLRTKASENNLNKIVRLQVSNGVNNDETVVYFNPNVTNGLDNFDSYKMFNNVASVPEIFTQVGNEKLVINGLTEATNNTEVPLGFVTGVVNNFTLKATELKNFGVDTKIILKDKQNPATEFDLTTGVAYNFNAGVTTASTDRFSLIFRTTGATTGLETAKANINAYVNGENRIVISASEKSVYSIYNAMGQLIENGIMNSKLKTQNSKLTTGVYVVRVNNESTRVIVK